ncbi:sensor histidine kinase [Thiospirochaeta perfilievii]|nr:HAMP domain-containing sensor histidine kinase [Thiospirochaeta perfilievii]
MALDIDIKNKLKRIIYSRILWIIILNAILVFIPISGFLIIKSKDYKALNLRSLTNRELSRTIMYGLKDNLSMEYITFIPVIAPYQRVLVINSINLKPIYDTRWLTNYAIESFNYDLPFTRIIGESIGDASPPKLSDKEIINRMSKFIKSGENSFSIIDYRFIYSLSNFSLDNGVKYSLIVLSDKFDLIKNSKIYKIYLLLVSIISILISIIINFVYYRLIIKPLKVLTNEVKLVKSENKSPKDIFSMRNRVDEIGLLSKAFYITSMELIDQKDSLRTFSSDVLHELKNPLTGIRNGIEILQINLQDDAISSSMLSLLSKESGRLEKLLFDIREYSLYDRVDNLSKWCSPSEIIEKLQPLYHKAEIKTFIKTKKRVKLSEPQFISILTNLIDNALSFSPEPGSVTIKYYTDGDSPSLLIKDLGPGIPQEEKCKIFRRFYSNRLIVDGEKLHSGLGLSIVKNILQSNNHTIKCMDNKPKGTIFIVKFSNM